MLKLATLLRSTHFLAHRGHLLTHGDTFYQDHKALAGLYEEYFDAYDDVVERMIGLGEDVDVAKITAEAANMDKLLKQSDWFKTLLKREEMIQKECKTAMEGATEGTKNLLAGLADQSEMRAYKLRQRTR